MTIAKSSQRALRAIALLLALVTLALPVPGNASERRFSLLIHDGALEGAEETIRVEQGDAVTLEFTSDQPIELHLHGYDLTLDLQAGEPALLQFTASFSGRFPVEAHASEGGHHHGPLLYLEVYPQ